MCGGVGGLQTVPRTVKDSRQVGIVRSTAAVKKRMIHSLNVLNTRPRPTDRHVGSRYEPSIQGFDDEILHVDEHLNGLVGTADGQRTVDHGQCDQTAIHFEVGFSLYRRTKCKNN